MEVDRLHKEPIVQNLLAATRVIKIVSRDGSTLGLATTGLGFRKSILGPTTVPIRTSSIQALPLCRNFLTDLSHIKPPFWKELIPVDCNECNRTGGVTLLRRGVLIRMRGSIAVLVSRVH